MKKLLQTATLLLIMGCGAEEGTITTDLITQPTSIEFENERYEFGSVTQGEKVKHTFNFTNTGNTDLIITSAKGSCGCTVPEWPKRPIKPGEKGEVNVVFNTENKSGKQTKKVTVVANTDPSTNVVVLSGDVIAPTE